MTADTAMEAIAARHGIELLLQFGSTVTGKTHARSDVDVAVLVTDGGLTLEAYSALHGDLQAVFPGRLDLALLNHADPLFLKKVLEHCRLLYGTLRRLHELRMYAFRRYQDHRKYLALERDYVQRELGVTQTR